VGQPESREEKDLEAGEIRLLKPISHAASRRAWFIAVLERCGADGWYVAPFSALPLPAFEGELELGVRRPTYLRTLCVWNVRRVNARALARASWPCGRLGAADLRAARAAWNAWRTGAPLPRMLRDRVGPPLTHPRDPRREYEAAEESAWDETAAALEDPAAGAGEQITPFYVVPDSARLMAAEAEDARRVRPSRRRRGGSDAADRSK